MLYFPVLATHQPWPSPLPQYSSVQIRQHLVHCVSTLRVAVRVVPLYVAEILAEVEMRTMDVFTVNVALVAPAGMNTLDGTLATPLLLERMTVAPPAGAGALSVTLPVEDCTPPMTVLGFSVSEDSIGGGGGAGFTVSEAVLVTPA